MNMHSRGVLAAGIALAGLVVTGAPAAAQEPAPTYIRASVKTGSAEVSGAQFDDAAVSDDGRFTVFSSNATDLVPGDTNGAWDVFLRDSVADVTTRLSVSSSGEQTTRGSYSGEPSMSADGRYVVFISRAPNLVADDTNDAYDVFLRDTVAGTTTRVSLPETGGQAGTESSRPAISADGRFVAFESWAPLVAGDTDTRPDVYLRDLTTGRTVLVSESFDGSPLQDDGYGFDNLSVTSGGRYIAFDSGATNLVAGDTNGKTDSFVRDLQTGTTVRTSVSGSGAQADASSYGTSISADGRYVAFTSLAKNLVPGVTEGRYQAYVRDLVEGTTTLASVRDGVAYDDDFTEFARISADGRHVAFQVYSAKDPHPLGIFIRDLDAQTTRRVTLTPAGGYPNGESWGGRFSRNGKHLVFKSEASDLVDGDTNNAKDIFVRLNVG
ncbi:TolB family protein [Krasilnikovia sp. MM14-A1004]|uniref:TolB family protein n=1 Tax=Krasilnikovia sp. MM14-A1004 TaxID=3373541 RepID=UPI00399CFCA8